MMNVLRASILEQIQDELFEQDKKWGFQSHASVDPILLSRESGRMEEEYEIPSENRAQQLVEMNRSRGQLTWAHILVEEVSEAVAARTEEQRIEELEQIAALCIQWIADIKLKQQ